MMSNWKALEQSVWTIIPCNKVFPQPRKYANTHTTSLSAECNQSSSWDQSRSRYLVSPVIDSRGEPPESQGNKTAEVSRAVGTSDFQSLGCLKSGQLEREKDHGCWTEREGFCSWWKNMSWKENTMEMCAPCYTNGIFFDWLQATYV